MGSHWVISELHGRTINHFAYLSPTEKFHAVVFARSVDAYMNRFEDCFRFMIIQVTYRNFEVYLSDIPKHGCEHFKSWLSSNLSVSLDIEKKFELDINVLAEGKSIKQGKNTYFIQQIDSDQF